MEMQWDSSTFKPGLLLATVVEGTTWKCSGIAVQLHMNCYYLLTYLINYLRFGAEYFLRS